MNVSTILKSIKSKITTMDNQLKDGIRMQQIILEKSPTEVNNIKKHCDIIHNLIQTSKKLEESAHGYVTNAIIIKKTRGSNSTNKKYEEAITQLELCKTLIAQYAIIVQDEHGKISSIVQKIRSMPAAGGRRTRRKIKRTRRKQHK